MTLGFTGTRIGMTDAQLKKVSELFSQLKLTELHHGDCIGADVQAHNMARRIRAHVVIHPSNIDKRRAFMPSPVIRLPKPPLKRNYDIVDESLLLIATPAQSREVTRSGTWATIRHGRKRGRRVLIVWPDGQVSEGNPAVRETHVTANLLPLTANE